MTAGSHIRCSNNLLLCVPDAASKHAVQAFFDSLRAEVEEYSISVSTINHTFISRLGSREAEAAASKSIWSCECENNTVNRAVKYWRVERKRKIVW